MQFQRVKMSEINPRLPKSETGSYVDMFLHEPKAELGIGLDQRYPAVVLFPGGAYYFTSERESDPVALKFFAAGYQVFLVRYSVAPDRYPTALCEGLAMVKHLRDNAEKYAVEGGKIAVCGFSAGGHLAASVATLWKTPVVADVLGCDGRLCRPDRMILCYPVITSGEYAHRQSFEMLLGKDAPQELVASMALETRFDADTPPAFIWSTFADELVPVENTLLAANSLRRAGVRFELHIFPDGPHGLALADGLTRSEGRYNAEPHVAQWMRLCLKWLDREFSNNQ